MVVIYKMLPIGSSTAEIPQPPIAKNRRVSFFGWPILRGYVSFRECNYPNQKITTLRTIQHNRLFLSKKMERLCFLEGNEPHHLQEKTKNILESDKNVQRDDNFRLGFWFNQFFRRRVLLIFLSGSQTHRTTNDMDPKKWTYIERRWKRTWKCSSSFSGLQPLNNFWGWKIAFVFHPTKRKNKKHSKIQLWDSSKGEDP